MAEFESVPTNFTKYHALNIARVDLSPPPLAVSKMFCFCFLFVRFSFNRVVHSGGSVESSPWISP